MAVKKYFPFLWEVVCLEEVAVEVEIKFRLPVLLPSGSLGQTLGLLAFSRSHADYPVTAGYQATEALLFNERKVTEITSARPLLNAHSR